jgi:peptidoglycan/xylan/chitin deacetylase (PgdA/CDA1 family)/uncharacterized protein YxeA
MKKVIVVIVAIVILLFSINLLSSIIKSNDNLKAIKKEHTLQEIKKHYNKYVNTNKEAIIYEYDNKNKKYNSVGKVSKDVGLLLTETKLQEKRLYFKIENMDYYIKYSDVEKADPFTFNNRYKSFVVFNENVITNSTTHLYDDDGLVFVLNKSLDLPIIIKENNKYGVEYNNRLLYINLEDVIKTYEKSNTNSIVRNNIRTFTYHTVYDPNTQVCNSIEICHTINQFDSHLKYLSDNNYLTLTMEELEMFLDSKIRIPINSIVITLDDGILLENSVPLVEKYKLFATFFVITGSHDATPYLNSKYARFETHTDKMHNNYKCKGGNQGSQLLCEKKDNIIADLKTSQEKLNGSYYFAYPFFDFNDNIISALKEAEIKMAFIGQWNTDGYSNTKTDKYLLRRKTIFGDLSFQEFIDYLNEK